jgi:hypothetical protein
MMRNRFKKLLIAIRWARMENQKKALDAHFNNWKVGREQLDDVCAMGIRI